ncbi:hypothetical protein [Pseudaestuariivita atlantica]|uniref:DUF302 domain-containing protein n=1 Tax=Pseudaestuariivita atlantica TaxID=1317121 RepID=A0A0L1JN40_9RHOB|nr:hypothetical protein [Pseudaestuariivita atlantica]KNG92823.1 hypothetical protein ATO11_15260 [Pseudaestuariivita atlantica]
MKPAFLALALGMGLATQVAAEGAIVVPFDGSFDDATFSVESAIVDRGLVIDLVSKVGDMLNRTGADVGSDVTLFTNADIFVFCSAVVSREVMEADPMNIVHCPYGIAVVETPDGVSIIHRDYPDGPMQKVEDLLTDIVAEAVSN